MMGSVPVRSVCLARRAAGVRAGALDTHGSHAPGGPWAGRRRSAAALACSLNRLSSSELVALSFLTPSLMVSA